LLCARALIIVMMDTAPKTKLFAAGDIVEVRNPDTSQWFPAVVCQVIRGDESDVKLLVEYENPKWRSNMVVPKNVRICHDFDW